MWTHGILKVFNDEELDKELERAATILMHLKIKDTSHWAHEHYVRDLINEKNRRAAAVRAPDQVDQFPAEDSAGT